MAALIRFAGNVYLFSSVEFVKTAANPMLERVNA